MGIKARLQTFRLWRLPLLIASGVTGTIVLLSFTGMFQLLEWAFLDQAFRWRPQENTDPRIVIVGISEADIAQLQQWPMSDQVLAQLLDRIRRAQPRVIGLDIYRDLPVEPGYAALDTIFRTTPNLIGIQKILGSSVRPPPALAAQEQVGMADFVIDSDAKIRRGLLTATDSQGNAAESLALVLALRYLEAEGITPVFMPDPLPGLQSRDRVRLGQATIQRFIGNDGGYQGADDRGYQILLNLRGPACRDNAPDCPFQMVSMSDVLADRVPDTLFYDRIVLIGPKAPSLGDSFYTSYSTSDLTAHTGIEVHAHLTSQLISAALDGRALIQTWPEWLEWLWTWVWAAGSAALGVHFLSYRWLILLGILGWSGGVLLAANLLFLAGWWVPTFTPLLAIGGGAIVSIGWVLWANLKLSYQQLEEYAQTLEQKVEARTQELRLEIEQRKQIELALREANEELQRISILDELTGIANRRCFEERLSYEWQRMLREQGFLSLILCDVDYFKAYNDTYGHPAGDRCLQQVAHALQQAARRTTDLVARYGGEEFAVLLPSTPPQGAKRVAEAIREELAKLQVEHLDSAVSQYVTVSLGVFGFVPSVDRTPQQLVSGADRALYQAKHQGRNRVALYVLRASDGQPVPESSQAESLRQGSLPTEG
ncbi:CHASE2 domain-containing protein [Trichothermofontia sp.]